MIISSISNRSRRALALVTTLAAYSISFFVATTQATGVPIQIKVGTQSSVSLQLNVDSSIERCNVEVTIPGGTNQEFEVIAPRFELQLALAPTQQGNLTVYWRGKTKFRGLKTVQACPGSGNFVVVATASDDQIRDKWVNLFARLSPEQSDCVRFGLAHKNLRFESIDPSAALVPPESGDAKAVFAKCDSFLSRLLRQDYDCTVLNGVRSRCEEKYVEEREGRLVPIRRDDALRRHFDEAPYRIAGFETAAGIEARKQDEAQKRQQAEDRRREQESASRANSAVQRSVIRSAPAPVPPQPVQAPRPVRGE